MLEILLGTKVKYYIIAFMRQSFKAFLISSLAIRQSYQVFFSEGSLLTYKYLYFLY